MDRLLLRRSAPRRFVSQPIDQPAAAPVVGNGAEEPGDALRLDHVSVTFGGLQALTDVSIRVKEDEVVGLIGANGAGKTTLLDCISGYERPHAGASITICGKPVVHL